MSLRWLVVIGLLAAEGAALANDYSIELAGGAVIPASTSTWTDDADTGWKIAGRGVGDVAGRLAVLGVEYARIPFASCDGFDRFRIMGGLAQRWSMEHVSVSARIAAGVEGVACTYTGFAPGTSGIPPRSRLFDVGLGGEAAVTLWLIEGMVDVGFEVGLPFSLHRTGGHSEMPQLDGFTMDLDVLLAFRVR